MKIDDPTLSVWRFIDGKPGHENQTLGLVKALAKELSVEWKDLEALPKLVALRAFLTGRPRIQAAGQPPDLIICAGHATHLTALAARRQRGGRLVVLMKPSLPLRWFDLCLIPEHDRTRGPNVIQTRGVLNTVRWSQKKAPGKGLILLGGPSPHGHWDSTSISRQIATIVTKDTREWTVASSRRTPRDTLEEIRRLSLSRLAIAPFEDAEQGWLSAQLESTSTVWVSEDSVSMLYEALSSGASCGLLRLSESRPSRVRSGIEQLLAEGRIVYVDDWVAGAKPAHSEHRLQEARRCSELIARRWFSDRSPADSSVPGFRGGLP